MTEAQRVKMLKDRTWLALDKNTADAAGEGCKVPDLQQWLVNAYTMSPTQLANLQRFYGCCR